MNVMGQLFLETENILLFIQMQQFLQPADWDRYINTQQTLFVQQVMVLLLHIEPKQN